MLRSLLAAVALLVATPATAQVGGGAPGTSTPEVVGGTWVALNVPPQVAVRHVRTECWRGLCSVHYAQFAGEARVRAADLVLHLDRSYRVAEVVDHLRRDLTIDPTPSLPREAAAQLVREVLPGNPAGDVAPSLAVVVTARGPRLVWEADLAVALPPDAFHVEVDAHDGAVSIPRSLAAHAEGRVYGLNPIKNDLQTVTLTGLPPGATNLAGENVRVLSHGFGRSGEFLEQFATADANGDFLFDPDPASDTDSFVEVNAYHHVSRASAFFADRFDHLPDLATEVVTNYREAPGKPYENAYAFANPDTGRFHIVTGQADELDAGYDAMILIHEYGHPIFDTRNEVGENNVYPINTDSAGFHPAPNALNEGFSDYWAGTVTGEPDVMQYLGDSDVASRHLERDARCPGDVWGEAHLDAPVVSTAMWELRGIVGAERADELGYMSIGFLSASPTFEEWGGLLSTGLKTLATDGAITEAQRADADGALERRGLFNCGRTVALTDGEERAGRMPGAETAAKALGSDADGVCKSLRTLEVQIPLAFPYTIEAPADVSDVEALEIALTWGGGGEGALEEGDLQYRVLVRKNEAVSLETVEIPFGGEVFELPIAAVDYDFEVTGEPELVRLEAAELGLEAGATYHVNILAMNCPATSHTIKATWVRPAPPEPEPEPEAEAHPDSAPDAGGGDVDTRVSGGTDDGCDAGGRSGSGGAGGLLAFALLALLIARRRSARGPAPR